MALVEGRRFLVVTYTDIATETTTRRYELDPLFAVGLGGVNLAALHVIFNAISKSKVSKMSVDQEYYDDAFAAPDANSNVLGDAALVTVNLKTYPNKKGSLSIPAPADTIFVSASGKGRNIIDSTDSALASFVALFAEANNDLLLSDGEYVVDDPANRIVGGVRKK